MSRVVALAFAALLTACAAGGSLEAASAEAPHTVTVSVVGLNDLHGKIAALPVLGGYVDNLQARLGGAGGVLVVDAGDALQGTLESNLTEGGSVVTAYQALGVKAAALGNHEFDFGPVGVETRVTDPGADPHGALEARIAEARFPFLCANLVERETKQPPAWKNLAPAALVEVAGMRIGLVGVLTAETPDIVMPAYFQGLAVTPLAAALAREAQSLRERGADAIVGLAHAGAACKRFDDPADLTSCDGGEILRVARELPPGLVDAIVAGHTHAGIAHVVNGIAIVEAYANGRAFSRVDLQFDAASRSVISRLPHPPEPLCFPDAARDAPCPAASYAGATVAPEPRVSEAIAPALQLAQVRREQPLGVSVTAPVRASFRVESALGNLFSDLLLAAVPQADVAIINGGGLRADLPSGELDYGRLYEALPFDNRIATLELTGEELAKVIVEHVSNARHGIISVAGIRATVRCERGELAATLERRNGARLEPRERVMVVTSDYLATGGDGLFAPARLAPQRIHPDLGNYVRDAIAKELRRRRGPLSGKDRALVDSSRPRLALPSPRPVQCG
jgi:5'-nucleotidase